MHEVRKTATAAQRPRPGVHPDRGAARARLTPHRHLCDVRDLPRGFKALEASEERTLATQLAETELARWKLTPESLPDQIVATDYNGNVIEGTLVGKPYIDPQNSGAAAMMMGWQSGALPMPGSTQYQLPQLATWQFTTLDRTPGALYAPDNLTSCAFDAVSGYLPNVTNPVRPASLHPSWEPDSLYLPRTVIGEQIDVMRLPSLQAAGGVPFYLLSHAPLDLLRGDWGNQSIPYVWMDVYDTQTWSFVSLPTKPLTLADRTFTYDATAKKLYFGPVKNGVFDPKVVARSFKLDYTDTNGNRIYGVTVKTGINGNDVGTADLDPNHLPPGDGSLMRVHEELVAMSKDDYKNYTDPNNPQNLVNWPRDQYYIDQNSTRVTGEIQFCPLLQTNPLPGDITLVKVDYRVQDWSILVFDVEVPPGGTVQLPLSHLKGSGFVNAPRQPRPQCAAKGVRWFWNPNTLNPDGTRGAYYQRRGKRSDLVGVRGRGGPAERRHSHGYGGLDHRGRAVHRSPRASDAACAWITATGFCFSTILIRKCLESPTIRGIHRLTRPTSPPERRSAIAPAAPIASSVARNRIGRCS